MRISRPLIALALPVVVAAACSDEYSTPEPQDPGAGSGVTEPGTAGMGPDTTGAGGSTTTGEPDPGMQGGINEGMNVDGPLSGGAGASPGAAGTTGTAAGGSGMAGGAPMVDPVTPVNVEGPCDIYAAAGQECVAAYSTVRRLLSTYTGPLYQIRVGSSAFNIGGLRVTNPTVTWNGQGNNPRQTTPEAGELIDIPQTADGFADVTLQQQRCPLGTTCTVSLLYDQSGRENHMPVAKGGQSAGGGFAPLDDFETVMDARAGLTVGGHSVFSLFMQEHQGYRLTTPGDGVPVDQEAQGIYMLADGTRAGGACCWDFGNVTPNPLQFSEMNTLFFGEGYWGDGNGAAPWFGADFEAGVWMGGSAEGQPGWGQLYPAGDPRNNNGVARPPNPNNPSMAGVKFALGFLKTNDDADNTYALRMANASTATEVQTAHRGRFPKLSFPNGAHGADNQGAVVLGVGGDNSNNSFGTFYEGAVVAGFPDDATELAVMQNIQAARYGQ
jgi:non-reducing end alpha-L-arabinofuranosidase